MRIPAREGRGEKGAVAAGRLSFLLAALLVGQAADPAGAGTYSVAGFSDTAVVTGLNQPTDFTWTPDGRMLVLEKVGRVRIVVGGTLQIAAALDLSASVDSGGEKGLLGICLDASFATNGFVYLYYTTRIPKNRISRFTTTGNAIDPASESVLLDGADATNGNHNGGTIAIGPDGKLWAAPGDSGTGGAKSQNLSPNSFNGKVLRMELDGSAAAGNPFLGDLTKEPRIWAYGFRNPYRFTFRPSNGSLYVADVGQSAREEIDVVSGGGNYGWPMMEGTLGSCAGCLLPVFDYDRTVGQAIIGGAFVTGSAYPAFLQGKYVFGDYVSSWIRYLDFDAGNAVVGTLQNLASAAEGPVSFHVGPDGLLYYSAINTGLVYRINPPPAATSFFTVTPCRIADTRQAQGPYGGPALSGGSSRGFVITGRCGVPASARSVSVNVTITQPTADGYLTAFASGASLPQTSLITFRAGQTRANNAILALGALGDATAFCGIPSPSGTVHVILDVNGYYQ
jgi:glucose/arabinose dehydrogenase